MERHYELLIVRQQNDKWLREIGRDKTGRLVRRVHPNRTKGRATKGIFRACRCGAEINFTARRRRTGVQVLMCLGCEGVVHLLNIPWTGRGGPAALPLEDEHKRGRLRNAGDQSAQNFQLRRRI